MSRARSSIYSTVERRLTPFRLVVWAPGCPWRTQAACMTRISSATTTVALGMATTANARLLQTCTSPTRSRTLTPTPSTRTLVSKILISLREMLFSSLRTVKGKRITSILRLVAVGGSFDRAGPPLRPFIPAFSAFDNNVGSFGNDSFGPEVSFTTCVMTLFSIAMTITESTSQQYQT